MPLRLLFVEPPKDYWFLMGEYLPPPTGLLILAAYVEREVPDIEIQVLDCQAQKRGWGGVAECIEDFSPHVVAASGFTCNAYGCVRVAQEAKRIDPRTLTVLGGVHFTALPEESLLDFPEVDLIVRGEGEVTLVDLLRRWGKGEGFGDVAGISFRGNGTVVHNPGRPLIPDLDSLPYPAYHLVEEHLDRYHFSMMAGKNTQYLIMEGSRGCSHRCSFCTQWRHWNGVWRTKSPKRIAQEMEFLHDEYGGRFLWLTDDNFDYAHRGRELYEELRGRPFIDDISWFFQARTDDIAQNPEVAGRLREVGNTWILMGVESGSQERLEEFGKGERVGDAYRAVETLRRNDILSQAMLVIGSREDTHRSIEATRDFAEELGSDITIFSVLTPFPGTAVHEMADRNGWIEDRNYANYDMVHAIMPTASLTRREVQEELLECYQRVYGSVANNLRGVFSSNVIKKRAYRHMAGKRVIGKLRRLI
ncbi:MAG: radical SAM protein [Methanomassiliicoccales archaeon]|nr:radical SAM protein [Methanomassiliicoccales archaeon]